MSSSFTSSTLSKASCHALSFYSTSSSSSPFGGSVHVDSHGFLKSSHRAGGPTLCSLPALTKTNIPSTVPRLSLRTQDRTASILGEHGLGFSYVRLVGRISKVDPEPEPILTMLIVMPDQPNPDKWYRALRHIQPELAKDIPGICVELIEEQLNRGIYCSPVNRGHPIYRKWPSIVDFILSHADFREWTALECWRYGTDTVRQLNPVTVIVQVRKTSTYPFITAARHLHGILAYFDLADVDVLFQRDSNTPLVQNPTLDRDVCAGAIHPGVSLGIHQCSAGTSTLGGLVQLQFSGQTEWRTYGLTCFHAVWPPTNHRNPEWFKIHNAGKVNLAIATWEFSPLDPRKSESFPDVAQQILWVDHPSLRDLDNTIKGNNDIIADLRTPRFLQCEKEMNKGDDGLLPESAQAHYRAVVRQIQAIEETRSAFIAMRDSGSYLLGHVYAGSGLNRTPELKNTEGTQEPRLISTDWALIKINPERLQPQQHGDKISGNRPFHYSRFGHPGWLPEQFIYDPNFEPLCGLKLHKCGRSTGITTGTYSFLDCVRFTETLDEYGMAQTIPTWEHKVASGPDGSFAEKGDSGSWIYTQDGAVVGILKSGDQSKDTGTMTLMSEIFDDIKSITGATNVRIAPDPDF
ncbi:hypothetical protein N7537_002750 [Penicillium hordei]|uniref:Uncharacterized protein n=1 Tax=Penicillium hordei TaxID=40994 RepID=A0AAD6EI16_9EURO|nr:uncharacterized protein N7537_002750 [Penicillium hordei]KAJ5617636.1 hypothetical protein N7537_002750 [Penicillium hordei]